MWGRLATVALCLAGATAQAQSADDNVSRLELCIREARITDAICSKMANDPVQRGDCFAKGRATQLECLDRVLSGAPAAPLSSETAPPQPPLQAATPPKISAEPSSSEIARPGQPEATVGTAPATETAKPSDTVANPEPANIAPVTTEASPGTIPPSEAENDLRTAREAAWIISETTSPVDYSPLVTAVLGSTSNVKNGPNTLTVRCRAQRTELSIRTSGAWAVVRGNELRVDYQISGRPVVRQSWTLSADGKTAIYKYDTVELLRSIPDAATLKIAVTDRSNIRLVASFEPTGLAGVRQKVGAACNWAPLTAKTSSEKP